MHENNNNNNKNRKSVSEGRSVTDVAQFLSLICPH